MREIKFRQVHFTPSGKLILITEWGILDRGMFASPHTVSNEDASKTVHMQYTGLKDKNGVEIYEGDIFKEDEEGTTDYVEWSDYFCGWATHTWWTPRDLKDSVGYYEVIGNIYENPDLLQS